MSNSEKRQDSRRRSARRHRSQAKRVLGKSVKRRQIGLDGLHAAQFQLLTLFPRIHRMHESIDEAFAGSPFLLHVAPDSPLNRLRFNTYMASHKEVMRLLERTLDLWMLACGMKLEDNWVPLLIEDMRQRAAAKAMEETPGVENRF